MQSVARSGDARVDKLCEKRFFVCWLRQLVAEGFRVVLPACVASKVCRSLCASRQVRSGTGTSEVVRQIVRRGDRCNGVCVCRGPVRESTESSGMYPFAADEAEMARRPIDWLGCVSSMCWYLEEGREEPIAMVGKKETLLIKCWANPSAREAALPRFT